MNEDNRERLARRQETNRALAIHLMALIDAYPDQRFGQILRNHDFIKEDKLGAWTNEFYLEPEELLARVRANSVK